MSKSSGILIAVEARIFSDGIELIINDEPDLHVSRKVRNKADLLEGLKDDSSKLLILDLDVPDLDIPSIITSILEKSENLKILVLSETENPEQIKESMNAGAAGFIFKRRGRDELINAIKVILGGNQYLCDDTINILTGSYSQVGTMGHSITELTERELEVLNLICREYTNKEIGDLLSISVRTVDTHRRNILQKTGAKNTAGLVKYAIKHNVFNIKGIS